MHSTDVSMWECVVILQEEIWLFQLTRQNYTTDGWRTADRLLVLVSQGSLEILHGKRSVKNTHGKIICLLRCLPFLMTNLLPWAHKMQQKWHPLIIINVSNVGHFWRICEARLLYNIILYLLDVCLYALFILTAVVSLQVTDWWCS